jgi:hypothetical protein
MHNLLQPFDMQVCGNHATTWQAPCRYRDGKNFRRRASLDKSARLVVCRLKPSQPLCAVEKIFAQPCHRQQLIGPEQIPKSATGGPSTAGTIFLRGGAVADIPCTFLRPRRSLMLMHRFSALGFDCAQAGCDRCIDPCCAAGCS